MTPERIAEAQSEVEFAEALGSPPPAWAVETLKHRGDPPMTEEQAGEVMHRDLFDEHRDPGAYEEARAVLEAGAPHRREFAELVAEIAVLAESKLGMAPWNAELHAKSEALAARQVGGSAEESTKNLRARRDAIKSQAVKG